MVETLYRRPLPAEAIAFSSPEGRQLFAEALTAGGLEGYFPLAEQFHTQSDPSFCGLGSLVVALNALGIDPGRLWKGPWRWFAEELLDCCVPLPEVRRRGLSIGELGCLARCNGAEVERVHADSSNLEAFRGALREASRGGTVLIAAYTRAALGQTGSGHFSPVGGYHVARDLALVLDVARFKYPPHWVPAERLFGAMLPLDETTRRARGWLALRRREEGIALGFSLQCDGESWSAFGQLLLDVMARVQSATDVTSLARAVAPLQSHLVLRTPSTAAHRASLDAARAALIELPAAALVREAVGEAASENVMLLVLAVLELVAPLQRAGIDVLTSSHPAEPLLMSEVENVRAQLAALTAHARDAGRPQP